MACDLHRTLEMNGLHTQVRLRFYDEHELVRHATYVYSCASFVGSFGFVAAEMQQGLDC